MSDSEKAIANWQCGHPTNYGACEKPYCHVNPSHWAEPKYTRNEARG